MKTNVLVLALLTMSGVQAAPWLKGTTDRDPLTYKVGEEITFTVTLEEAKAFPEGVSAKWTRTGDDGVRADGTWDGKAPLTVKTKLSREGFVRLQVEPQRLKDGKPWKAEGASHPVFFDGGAAADVASLKQAKPEPKDFDAFWKARLAEIAAMPREAKLEEVASPTKGVKLYSVRLNCPGGTGFTTGYLSVPEKPGKYMGVASFMGYGASWGKGGYLPPHSVPTTAIRFFVTAHGFELGREDAYYKAARKAAGSNGYGHGFDPVQNARPETCYFCGMAQRVIRAVEYLKTRPEWDGRELVVVGGSQGSLQAMWCAAFVSGVTEARLSVPWLCDVGNTEEGRNHRSWFPKWAPGLDYFDQVNVAKRVPAGCKVVISEIGLGDYTAPPCGSTIMSAALKCKKQVTWIQGATHGYTPPKPEKYREPKEK